MSPDYILLCFSRMKIIYTVLILGLLIAITTIPDHEEKSTKEAGIYAHTSAVIDTLPVIASEKAYWNSENSNIVGKQFVTGRDTADALISGNADFASMATLPFLLASSQHNNLKAIGVVTSADSVSIVGNNNSGLDQLAVRSIWKHFNFEFRPANESLFNIWDMQRDWVQSNRITPNQILERNELLQQVIDEDQFYEYSMD